MKLWEIFTEVVTDRIVLAGTGSSGTSIFGAISLSQTREWLAIFAALFGGLSALSVFVYTCIKIRRMLSDPTSKE